MEILDTQSWDQFMLSHPNAHILQCSGWGELKSGFGWYALRVREGECGAQILFRRLPLGFTIAYIPKGPVGVHWQAILPQIEKVCREHRAIFLKIEPDGWEDGGVWMPQDYRADGIPVQPRRTVVIDLSGQPENWLERMKQKTRYNIRLAQKKGVTIRETDDVTVFHQLMQVTGSRDGFGVHSLDYYRNAYRLFAAAGQVALFIAEFENHPLAGLMAFRSGERSWYLYGASNDEERNRMPTYLIQWQAMMWASARGCLTYDLWGVPDEDEATLEENFESRSDGLWGVYRFKRGFGGQVKRALPTYEKALNPLLYMLYRRWAAYRGAD